MLRNMLMLLMFLAFSMMLVTTGAAVADEPVRLRISDSPARLSYLGSAGSEKPGFAFGSRSGLSSLRSGLRADPQPGSASSQPQSWTSSRYRTHSILRYSKPLGDTGMVLRIKAPLKPRRLVKLELRF